MLHSWHIHPERRIQKKITSFGSLSPQTEALKCVAQASKNRSLADFEKVSQGHRKWGLAGQKPVRNARFGKLEELLHPTAGNHGNIDKKQQCSKKYPPTINWLDFQCVGGKLA